jgi:phospholipid transport system substrate-binding protein
MYKELKIIGTIMLACVALNFTSPAQAASSAVATPAETFVSHNIQNGFAILNDKKLSEAQRKDQFGIFLVGITDMQRLAKYTLGPYGRSTSPADLVAFEAAFQNYAITFYQSYFAKYAGQTLQVTGSKERSPGDYIVATNVIDPNDRGGQPPLEIEFRVNTDTGKPALLDISFSGISLALMEQDQMVSLLGNDKGSIPKLISQLGEMTNNLK